MNAKKIKRFSLLLCLTCFFNFAHAPANAQILASPVFDVANNAIGAIQKAVMKASKAIREEILPFKEGISKVQKFFKNASEKVNVVIVNLKMTHQLIKVEKDIISLYQKSIDKINSSENIVQKWRYQWILGQLYWESRNVFETFEISSKESHGIMDDEGRIKIIQVALKKGRSIHRAMRATIRRANKQSYKIRLQKRQLETFNFLFKTNG